MRISDWSSDVCSSDLIANGFATGFVNTSTLHFAGLIIAADYSLDIGGIAPNSDGRNMMRFGTKVFYTDRYDQQRFAGEPVTEAAGTVSLPRWRVQTNVGATLGDIDLDVQLRSIGRASCRERVCQSV